MVKELKRWGNSRVLVLPKAWLEQLGVTDEVEVEMQQKAIVIRTPKAQKAKGTRRAVPREIVEQIPKVERTVAEVGFLETVFGREPTCTSTESRQEVEDDAPSPLPLDEEAPLSILGVCAKSPVDSPQSDTTAFIGALPRLTPEEEEENLAAAETFHQKCLIAPGVLDEVIADFFDKWSSVPSEERITKEGTSGD